jgi:hypothetical protein
MTQAEAVALWTDRVAAQAASGLSVATWCAQHDVALHSFYAWRKRLTAAPAPAPAWVALEPASAPSPAPAILTVWVGAVAIEVPDGFDPRMLAAVLRVVAACPDGALRC